MALKIREMNIWVDYERKLALDDAGEDSEGGKERASSTSPSSLKPPLLFLQREDWNSQI